LEDVPDNVVNVVAHAASDDPWGIATEGIWAEPLGGARYLSRIVARLQQTEDLEELGFQTSWEGAFPR
jgi:hypothetical protein